MFNAEVERERCLSENSVLECLMFIVPVLNCDRKHFEYVTEEVMERNENENERKRTRTAVTEMETTKRVRGVYRVVFLLLY